MPDGEHGIRNVFLHLLGDYNTIILINCHLKLSRHKIWQDDHIIIFFSCHLWWVKELTLSLTGYNIQGSGSYTSAGQCSRTDLTYQVQVNQAENIKVGDMALSLICRMVTWVGGDAQPPMPLTICGRWESWIWVHESERCVLSPHQLQLRKMDLVPSLCIAVESSLKV